MLEGIFLNIFELVILTAVLRRVFMTRSEVKTRTNYSTDVRSCNNLQSDLKKILQLMVALDIVGDKSSGPKCARSDRRARSAN